MLSARELDELHEYLIGSEVRACFFADKCARLHRQRRVLRFCAGVLVAAAVTVPACWIMAGPALFGAYRLDKRLGLRADDAADLHGAWNGIPLDAARLQRDDEGDCTSRLADLEHRAATASAQGRSFRYEARAMTKWFDLALIQHRLAG